MKKFGLLAAGCLTLAVMASAILPKPTEETANPVRFEQIAPEHTEPQPASPNTRASLQTAKDTGWSAFTYGAVILFAGLFVWAIFSAHSDDQRFKKNPDDRLRTQPLPHPGKPGSFRMSSTPRDK